jgi:uncharacterized protein YndB with AHSA1/START domain
MQDTMGTDSLTIDFTVDRTPAEVFAAITDPRSWWSSDIDGPTDELGSAFTYRYQDVHRSVQRVTELVPGRRITWHVEDSYLAFIEKHDEWTGTDIIFDITPRDGATEVRFTHVGLVPAAPCYEFCQPAWQHYIASSLRGLLAGEHAD